MKKIAIIGGGPAALMLAAHLDSNKYDIHLFEKNKTVGRKFLVAGDGGLNLSYHASQDDFIKQYYPAEFMRPIIQCFDNDHLVRWLDDFGISTYIGSSNRIFPSPPLKPISVLNRIVDQVISNRVNIHCNAQWIGWCDDGNLSFDEIASESYDLAIYALGGASWKVTGSDGLWAPYFEEQGIKINEFKAANCSFEVEWANLFIDNHRGKPLKNISLSLNGLRSTGEVVITEFGLEGNAIYPLSRLLQYELSHNTPAVVYLDLKPTLSYDQLKSKIEKSKYKKVSDILKFTIRLDRVSIAVLKQFSDKETFLDMDYLIQLIKAVPIEIKSAGPVDKAISSLGGISLGEIDDHFQLNKMPNHYAIGEMLDWYAPTGGYLLQACFSMGYALANYLNQSD